MPNPLNKLLSVIAPAVCSGCGAEGKILCDECLATLDDLPSICFDCGKASANFKPCTKCLTRLKPQHVWICFEYAGAVADLVRICKFESNREAASIMGQAINATLPFFTERPLITYVPTSPTRRRARSFDQAELIARELARIRGWHYLAILNRVKPTRQLGAKREQRKIQASNAFIVARPELVSGRHVIIVDDVVTTGATLEACAKELIKAGASQVDAAVFARTPNK
jgi:ComF family protein